MRSLLTCFLFHRPRKTSEVDDDFFNLEEFNKWTEQQEELDMMSDREDQEDDIDYDRDLEEEDDPEEEDDMNDAAGKHIYLSSI